MTRKSQLLKTSAIVTSAVFVVLMIAAQTEASTFADYRHRVSQAVVLAQQLQAPDFYSDEPTQREAEIAVTIADLKLLMPATETVLLGGQRVEVDNAWLHDALLEYEKNKNNNVHAAASLKRIGQRLQALVERLDETKVSSAASQKDADKARLAEILRRREYDKRVAEGSAIQRLWDRFIRWLASLFPETRALQPGTSRALSSIAQVVVIAISLALIAFLIWRFVPRFLRNRAKKKPKREARIVLGERLEPDQTAADLLEQAEALARAGDLRGAIRKAYIALLCELGDRKVISLAQHKTNRDYLMSVRQKPSLFQSMRKLTASFELHWYGFVPPVAEDWAEFSSGCRAAVASEK